jgi:hypothetical protein
MRKVCKFISLALFAAVTLNPLLLHAEDEGVIIIRIFTSTDTAKDTPAETLLTDPQNRRTGYDALAPFDESSGITEVHEIPNSSYFVEGIGDNTGGGEDEPFYRELYVPTPIPGKYIIQIIGRKTGGYRLSSDFYGSDDAKQEYDTTGFTVDGQIVTLSVEFDPTPGAPAPVITKIVTFDILRNDVLVAQKLNQLGDDKCAKSLGKNIALAEKLAGVCDRRKGKKDKGCQPAVAVLKLFIKRLELANRKCDNSADCDEEREWAAFRKEHGKDAEFGGFWREWDRDDWHKHKKAVKRFVTDEALTIIREDAGWLIKSLEAAGAD